MDIYETSPYLHVHKLSNNEVVMNHLINHLFIYSSHIKEILEYCSVPHELNDLTNKYGNEIIKYLKLNKFLLKSENKWELYRPWNLEVETSTVCNWSCVYCPVRYYNRKPRFMELSLFENIIKKASEYGNFKTIALHSYNEPTIDPNFKQYIELISQTDIKLELYTNGSALSEKLTEFLLSKKKCIQKIVFNFPSADRLSFIKTTGANTFEKSSDSVNRLIKNGIKPILNVIDSNRDGLKDLGQMFPKAKINAMPSFNRAGSLKKGGENGKLNNVLKGCSILIQSANINIDGEVFMCSNDFHHKSVYGNIKENSFENIFKSKDFQDKIKQVFGFKKADDELICLNCDAMSSGRYHCGIFNTDPSYNSK